MNHNKSNSNNNKYLDLIAHVAWPDAFWCQAIQNSQHRKLHRWLLLRHSFVWARISIDFSFLLHLFKLFSSSFFSESIHWTLHEMVNKRQRDGSLSMQWQKPLATPRMYGNCMCLNKQLNKIKNEERMRGIWGDFWCCLFFKRIVGRSTCRIICATQTIYDSVSFELLGIILLKCAQGIVIRRFGVPKWTKFLSKGDTFNIK